MAQNDAQGLPSGWAWTRIGSITQPIEKVQPKEKPDTRFTYLDISSIDNDINQVTEPKSYLGAEAPSRARQLVQANDVLFSTVRTYLRNIALVPETLDGQVASTGFSVLRGEQGIVPRYLFYYSLTESFLEELGKLQRGTSYPAVRDGDVRAQPIPLAPLAEQQRIVAEIETHFTRLDAGVAALKRAQANLRRYKASVLKAACEGRLVPTEAELARQEGREYEPADVLLERILAERRERWEAENPGKKYKEPKPPDKSDLPELPEGWLWASVRQVGEVKLGRQRAPRHHSGPYMRPYLRVANVFEDCIETSDVLEMNFTPEEYKTYVLRFGDILLNEGQSLELVGRPAIFRNEIPGACFQNTLVRFRHAEDLPPEYALCVFRGHLHGGVFRRIARWTTNIAHLGATRFAGVEFPLPPLAEQHRIVTELERQLSLVRQLEKQVEAALRRAERLRQAILKHAFEGKLVPQDPNDEPASVLLARIQAERSGQAEKTKVKEGNPEQLKLANL